VGKPVTKTVAALLAAVAAVALGLNGADVVSLSRRALVTAVVVSAALAFGSTTVGAWGEWRARRLGAQHELADLQLTAAAWAIVDQVGGSLDYRDLGLAVYRVERVWWRPWTSRLRRVHRVRAKRRPTTSDIAWQPGKGVIGRCVQQGAVVAADMRQLYAGLGSVSRLEWDTLVPDDVRLGMTFEEYLDVRDKYDVVVASPMIDDSGSQSRVRGCVALDGPAGRFTDLTRDEVLGLLDSAAQGLLRQSR
jgi:hypothetical protein